MAGPDVPQALAQGAHVITNGEGLLDATIVIAVNGKFLQAQPELVKRYMKVHAASLQFMKDHPEEVYQMAAQETGLSVDQVKEMYPWYDFAPAITAADRTDLDKTQDFLIQNGLLAQKIDLNKYIQDMTANN